MCRWFLVFGFRIDVGAGYGCFSIICAAEGADDAISPPSGKRLPFTANRRGVCLLLSVCVFFLFVIFFVLSFRYSVFVFGIGFVCGSDSVLVLL